MVMIFMWVFDNGGKATSVETGSGHQCLISYVQIHMPSTDLHGATPNTIAGMYAQHMYW